MLWCTSPDDKTQESDKYELNFNVSIAETDFVEKFFNYINQATRGTFYGTQEGREKLKSILVSRHLCNV